MQFLESMYLSPRELTPECPVVRVSLFSGCCLQWPLALRGNSNHNRKKNIPSSTNTWTFCGGRWYIYWKNNETIRDNSDGYVLLQEDTARHPAANDRWQTQRTNEPHSPTRYYPNRLFKMVTAHRQKQQKTLQYLHFVILPNQFRQYIHFLSSTSSRVCLPGVAHEPNKTSTGR